MRARGAFAPLLWLLWALASSCQAAVTQHTVSLLETHARRGAAVAGAGRMKVADTPWGGGGPRPGNDERETAINMITGEVNGNGGRESPLVELLGVRPQQVSYEMPIGPFPEPRVKSRIGDAQAFATENLQNPDLEDRAYDPESIHPQRLSPPVKKLQVGGAHWTVQGQGVDHLPFYPAPMVATPPNWPVDRIVPLLAKYSNKLVDTSQAGVGRHFRNAPLGTSDQSFSRSASMWSLTN